MDVPRPDQARSSVDRFMERVPVAGPDDCWLWQGSIRNGYGQLKVGSRSDGTRRTVSTHRLAWELANGPIPEGLFVLHSCDVKACVNPAHLRLGTAAENSADAVERGQYPSGERHGSRTRPQARPKGESHSSAKLTEAQVREIRIRCADGETQVHLAAEFGVTQPNIGYIVRRTKWKHVT